MTNEEKVFFITNTITAVQHGVIKRDLETENAVRRALDLAEREEEEITPSVPEPDTPTPEPNEPELIGEWSDGYRIARDKLIDQVRKKKIVTDGLYREVGNLKLVGKKQLGDSLAAHMLNGLYFGALQAQREVTTPGSTQRALSAPAYFKAPTLDEFAALFAKRGLEVTPAIKQAARAIKDEAFFITDVTSESVLGQARQVVYRGVRKGDLHWTENELEKLFDKLVETGELKPGTTLGSANRVEAIARTNFTSAINQGRKVKFEDPDVAEFIEAYMWSSVMDDRVTPYCASMDGKHFRKGELSGRFPPAHHLCRSLIVPTVRGEDYTLSKLPDQSLRGQGFNEGLCCG
jgi:SPP1 gp7 family putative phage head morphogenesis protein